MPLNQPDQGIFDEIKQNLIDAVNPFDIMPSLVGVFTQQDRQMLTQTAFPKLGDRQGQTKACNIRSSQTEKFGNRYGMMDLLDKYENKAKNLDPLFDALKQANYSIGKICQDEPPSATHVEAKEAEQLDEDLKRMEEKLEQQQIKDCEVAMARQSTSEDKSVSSINYEKPSTAKLGNLQFPTKSILLVGGWNGSLYHNMEVYCTEDGSNSKDLHINSRIPQREHVGCKIGKKIIISSGINGESLTSTEFFDIPTGQWTDGSNLNEGRQLAMSAAVGDTFFVFGGRRLKVFDITSAEKLQISSSATKWQSIQDLPHTFYSGNAVAVNEMIYIIGNESYWQLYPKDMTSLIYVPTYDQYLTRVPAMEERKLYFASTLLNYNTIVVTGGTYAIFPGTLNSCQMLDIRNKKWEPLSDMNIARCHHKLVNVDDKLYAIGGRGGDNNERLSSVEMYDIRNNKWTDAQPLKYQRAGFTAFAL